MSDRTLAGVGSDSANPTEAEMFYRHPQSLVESKRIGKGTRIHAFARISQGAEIGCNTTVSEHVYVAGDVVLGDRVTVHCGVQLWDGLLVDDDVVIGPNATFSNETPAGGVDKWDAHAVTHIARGATIGANATVLSGLAIGQCAVIRPGAVVTHGVPAYAIVSGNPSQIVGYVWTSGPESEKRFNPTQDETSNRLRVKGASLVRFPKVVDLRGMTTFAEIEKHLPFVATRFFVVSDVPSREIRGEHAHKTLHEFLVCLKGSFAVMLDDGVVRDEVAMDSPTLGLHVPPQVWRVVYKYSPDAVMLSLCSHVYDPDDYIRDYSEFLAFVGAR